MLILSKKFTKQSRMLYAAVFVVCIVSVYPVAHAGILDVVIARFKVILAPEEAEETETRSSTSMDALHPLLALDSGMGSDDPLSYDQESLHPIVGPLRLSTEDVVFPTTDEISSYEVKQGDTVEDVAKLFGVTKNTVIWANNLRSQKLVAGQSLIILPVSGIKHRIVPGDTIDAIAKKYRADQQDIALFNGVSLEGSLTIGETIIVPDGEIQISTPQIARKPSKPRAPEKGSALAMFKPVNGIRTQGIHGHNAVDIAAPVGSPVYSTLSGTVIAAKIGGYNGGYGNMVIISHANGVQTVYAHMNSVAVSAGDSVSRGQSIGTSGNTGRSTGPHLHFEVRGSRNPF